MRTFILDTGTTSFDDYPLADLIEACLINGESGEIIYHGFFNPDLPLERSTIEYYEYPNDIKNSLKGKPHPDKARQDILEIVKDSRVIIYNAYFDKQFFPSICDVAEVECVMSYAMRLHHLQYPTKLRNLIQLDYSLSPAIRDCRGCYRLYRTLVDHMPHLREREIKENQAELNETANIDGITENEITIL